MTNRIPEDIAGTEALLAEGGYLSPRPLATAVFLSLTMPKPLFLEGEAGVGKTEVAKTLAAVLGRELIRLQCWEGIDVSSAAYEWDYSRQLLEAQLARAEGEAGKGRGGRSGKENLGGGFFVEAPAAAGLGKIGGWNGRGAFD